MDFAFTSYRHAGLTLCFAILLILVGSLGARAQWEQVQQVWHKTTPSGVVAYSPTDPLIVTAQGFKLWRVSDGVCLKTLAASVRVNSVAFAPDGETLAAGNDDDTIKLWQVSSGSYLQTFAELTGPVQSISFVPDGQTLASGCYDDTVRLWRVSDGTCLAVLNKHTAYGIHSVAFAPDGQQVASGGEDGVAVWSNLSKLTAVALSVAPSAPQPVNTTVNLTAIPTGGVKVQYRFRAGYTDALGWHWSDLTDYTTTASCTWRPTFPASYTLVVWARETGHTASYDVYSAQGYQVNAPALTAVTLTVAPPAPQPVNTAINLSASPTGGGKVEFKFRAGYTDVAGWHWSDLTGYTTAANCSWTPGLAAGYTLVVWARTVGHSAAYDVYSALAYQVTAPKLTAVALGAMPVAPQAVKTAITLTAMPTGGGTVEYKFRAGYTDAAGWHWSDLTGYTTTATCTWTPGMAATYTLVVWARTVGHTAIYDVYNAVGYQVTAPTLSAVSLSTTPAAPQPVKTAITLTAAPTGGSTVEYRFRAGYTDAAGWHWSDLTGYTTTTTCTWTPALAITYTLVVWARAVGHTGSYDVYKAITYQAK